MKPLAILLSLTLSATPALAQDWYRGGNGGWHGNGGGGGWHGEHHEHGGCGWGCGLGLGLGALALGGLALSAPNYYAPPAYYPPPVYYSPPQPYYAPPPPPAYPYYRQQYWPQLCPYGYQC